MKAVGSQASGRAKRGERLFAIVKPGFVPSSCANYTGHGMDKLKLYAAPLIAVLILLAWFFVIRPSLSEDAGAPAEAEGQDAEASDEAAKAPEATPAEKVR